MPQSSSCLSICGLLKRSSQQLHVFPPFSCAKSEEIMVAMCGLYVRRECPRCRHKTREVTQVTCVRTREEVKGISRPVAPTIICMKCGKDAGITHGAVPNGTSFTDGKASGPPFQGEDRKWYPMYFTISKGEVVPDFNAQGLLRVINDRLEHTPGLKKCGCWHSN